MKQSESSKLVEMRLGAYDNSWYHPGAGPIKRTLWLLVNALFLQNPLNPLSSIKILLLRLFGAKIGRGVTIKPGVSVKYPWWLEIGNDCWIGEDVWIDNLTTVRLGNNVCLSQGALLLTGNHNYKKPTFDLLISSITLEDGVWIGAKAIVCPGIICFSHSVLAVGSIATHNLDPYKIYQGNPAKYARDRNITDFEESNYLRSR